MKKTLFLSVMNGAAWGGSEELWYQAALWTARNGLPAAVCCFDWPGRESRFRELKNAGCELFLLPGKEETKKQPLLGKIKLNKAVADIPFEEYDKVIVSQGGWKDVAHGPFKKLYRRLKDYVLIFHNYNVNEKFSLRKFLRLQKWTDNASRILGDTPLIFESLSEAYSLSFPKYEKIYNPLTFPAPDSATPYPVVNRNYIFSVFAALDTERKAQDLLIKAMAESQWKDRNWELHIYGEGKDKDLLQNLIGEFGLTNRVTLKGNAGNYKEAIANSHLVLQITHIDAMPLTVMDSLAMARPVIVSSVGDMPSWVRQDLNGWVSDAVTVEAINSILEKAWSQKENWESMGKRSYELFRKEFPPDPITYFLKQVGILFTP